MSTSHGSSTSTDILLVEDNQDDIELTLRVFKKYDISERTHVVRNGAEALDFLFARASYAQRDVRDAPKVVLLDLKLPLVGGLQVLQTIKQDARTRQIPVVVLTSSDEERDITDSYRFGANSYIVKPVAFESFEACLRSIGEYWVLLNRPLERQMP